MSYINPNRVFGGFAVPWWLAERRDVGPAAKLVYGRLANLAWKKGFAWPSYSSIAKDLGTHIDTVIRATKELEKAKLIERRAAKGRTNRFLFFMPTGLTIEEGDPLLSDTPTPPQNAGESPPQVTGGSIRGSIRALANAKDPWTAKHRAFMSLWALAYEEDHGRKYVFAGGKDAGCAKRLLKSSGLEPEAIIAIARQAWQMPAQCFYCGHAITISGLSSSFNGIRNELERFGKKQKTITDTVIERRIKALPDHEN